MANRILIDGNQIKVSAPGVDVFSASESQLLFNSAKGNGKILQYGTASLLGGSGWKSFSFGGTFTNRPLVFFQWNNAVFLNTCRYWNTTLYLALECYNDHFNYIRLQNPSTVDYYILDWNMLCL